jgi:hypothetical protein
MQSKNAVKLSQLYPTGTIGAGIAKGVFRVCRDGYEPGICQVRSFSKASPKERAGCMKTLAEGSILVSEATNEPGFEYVAPLFDKAGSKLVAVLAVQVKGGTSVPTKVGQDEKIGNQDICGKLLEWTDSCASTLFDDVRVIPVLLMVAAAPVAKTGVARRSVQVVGLAMQRWLGPLQPLRMLV